MAVGSLYGLDGTTVALFCSRKCPGDAILADEIVFAHAAPGGKTDALRSWATQLGKPVHVLG